MLGKRKTYRIKRSFYVQWRTLANRGQAKVVNISVTGLSMEIYSTYEPTVGEKMFIEGVETVAAIPECAEVIWVKKLLGGMKGVECGLKFTEVKK